MNNNLENKKKQKKNTAVTSNYYVLKSKKYGNVFWTRAMEINVDKYEILFKGIAEDCKKIMKI